MSYFHPRDIAPIPVTFTHSNVRSQQELLAEIGDLNLRLAEAEKRLFHLQHLEAWILRQPVIFTPAICCEGVELPGRIREERALQELRDAASRRSAAWGGL
ncbi:MAG TPA: hypothetical protein VN736_28805 [Candidatus Limnocylindrales bacterium]|nr:hypothetical protein [Candidatus Limnocylindrales bacterium]